MSLPVRVVTLLVATALVIAGIVFVFVHFIFGSSPPAVDYTAAASGGQVNLTFQTDPQTTVTDHPDWVSYFIKDPRTGSWEHTTYFTVPAHTRVNVTVLGYDGCTPLRNPYFGQVTGTIGGVEYVNGKPVSTFDSWSQCSVEHTFAIPALGLNVPIASPTSLKENNNLCSTSPCTSGPHQVVQFSFMTPSKPGVFRWQCFIPCGAGFVDGNGGPMSALGYMVGQMEVVS